MTLVFDPVKALDHVVTLVAAFAGAYAAFRLEHSRRQEEFVSNHVAAANRALYTIFTIWNAQEQLRKDIVEPWRGKHDAWFNMPATPTLSHGATAFDTQGLEFLLGRDSHLFSRLMLEEQRHASLMQNVEDRSRLILGEVWPHLAANNVTFRTSLSPGQIEAIIGIDRVRRMTVYTDSIVKHVYENLASLVAVHDALRNRMMDLYPLRKFIKIQFSLDEESRAAVAQQTIAASRDT